MRKIMRNMAILTLAWFQVGCGGKDKSWQSFMQKCTQIQACMDMYKNAARQSAIQGFAATRGLPQVAQPGTTPAQGQVSAKPASVTNAQIQQHAEQVLAKLNAMGDGLSGGSAGASTSTSSSGGIKTASATGFVQPSSLGGSESLPLPNREPAHAIATASGSAKPVFDSQELTGGLTGSR